MKKFVSVVLIILITVLCIIPFQVKSAFLPPVYSEAFSGTLSQTLNESLTIVNDGFSTITFYITVPTGGAIMIEGNIIFNAINRYRYRSSGNHG